MPIPDFQTFFRPLLAFAADGIEHSIAEAREALADHFQLSESDLNQYLPSGTQKTYDNRVAWAKSYLLKANALKATRRAHFVITDRGRELLDRYPDRIDIKILNQFDEFRSFHSNNGDNSEDQTSSQEITSREETPEELLEESYNNIRDELQSELLETIKSNTPEFFEKLVVDLMLALGYGGSRKDAGESLGKSGDEGIDGTIKEDKLGLDVIYLQAKKWEGTVGRPEIQKFVGALHGKRARKGVFITTGRFSSGAQEYVKTIDPKVILIDGERLANYMIDHNLGVSTKTVFEIKRMDTDYFVEE